MAQRPRLDSFDSVAEEVENTPRGPGLLRDLEIDLRSEANTYLQQKRNLRETRYLYLRAAKRHADARFTYDIDAFEFWESIRKIQASCVRFNLEFAEVTNQFLQYGNYFHPEHSIRVDMDGYTRTPMIFRTKYKWYLDAFVWTRLVPDGDGAIAVRVLSFLKHT